LAGKDFVALQSERLGRRVIGSQGRNVISAELSNATGFERTLKASNTTQEWRTPPLWGVGDSAPYMHDGRAKTLLEAIAMHDGESAGTRDRFLRLPLADRRAVIGFLETLVAPPNAVPQL
jgi:cytochrome c peroxidase